MKNYRLPLCFLITFCTALLIVLWAFLAPIDGNEMGYCILNYYILFPFVSLLLGLFAGKAHTKLKWTYILFAGVLSVGMPYPVFHTVNAGMVFLGMVPAFVGVVAGSLMLKRKVDI